MTYSVASPENPAQVVFIMGPTASGKTGLGIELAQRVKGEIISVDSALIYRDMDIGTAKPDMAERQGIVHHLIDICDATETYSVSRFKEEAETLIADIIARGNLPILVGGTMMYYNALVKGLSALPRANQCVRDDIQERAQIHGWQLLHDELAEVDPEAARRIHPNDPQRLIRALEVYQLTQRPLTELQKHNSPPLPYCVAQFAIAPEDRSVLHQRISQRFDIMLKNGLVDEVRSLYLRGDLHEEMTSIRCVGYRQVWQYLVGKLSYEEMIERGVIATRQLAKRQITWLRGWEDVTWLDTFAQNNIEVILKLLKK